MSSFSVDKKIKRIYTYLHTFLVGHFIARHVIYRSDYPFDIFKLFLLVIVLPVMGFTVLITPLISSNLSYQYNNN